MAMRILEECISCGSCEPECPNEAIAQGDPIYTIDSARCTECVGAYDTPKCVELCPIEGCIVEDPGFIETREALQAKYEGLHA
jgi:ferredoxin